MQNPTQTPAITSYSNEYTKMQNPSQTPAIPSNSNEYTHWSRNVTLRLIDEYKKNHKNVGSKIRSFKILYEIIANILNAEFGLKLSGPQVNNKFQTLVRSYKSVVDNNKKTGRSRKSFEFEEQMEEIFQKSKRINPDILLTETEVIKSTSTFCNKIPALQRTIDKDIMYEQEFENIGPPGPVEDLVRTPITKTVRNLKRKGTRSDVLEMIRNDKQKFYENYLNIQNSKLVERKRKNDLLEEKNKLLKEYLINNSK